jgi:hypothetical protein
MTKRQISIKKRGSAQRKDKSVYLIITEGKNKTETLYLSHFQEQGKDYRIQFVKAGNNTDAESLYKILTAKWEENELSEEKGDKGFIVLDIDNDPLKAQKVQKIIHDNRYPAIEFIVSNPTFEIWFLLHFKYTTRQYENGEAVIKDLKKYIERYAKNGDYFDELQGGLKQALKYAQRLETHHGDKPWPAVECNPRTDMGNVIKKFL